MSEEKKLTYYYAAGNNSTTLATLSHKGTLAQAKRKALKYAKDALPKGNDIWIKICVDTEIYGWVDPEEHPELLWDYFYEMPISIQKTYPSLKM